MMAEENRIKIEMLISTSSGKTGGSFWTLSALSSGGMISRTMKNIVKFLLKEIKKIEREEGGEDSELITDEFSKKKRSWER